MVRRLLLMLLFCCGAIPAHAGQPWIIGAAPAAGWPGNCLASLAVLLESGAETIQLSVAMNSDDDLLVVADPQLSGFTDAVVFAADKRDADGNILITALSGAEVRQLRVITPPPDDHTAVAPALRTCAIPTLAEVLDLVALVEHEQQRVVTVVVEMRKIWLHRASGKDLAAAVIDLLRSLDTADGTSQPRAYVAAHDADELRRIHDELLADTDHAIGIIQLIGHHDDGEVMRLTFGRWQPYDSSWMLTNFGLRSIAAYTDAIGLPPELLLDAEGAAMLPGYIAAARDLGLRIIAYPADSLLDRLPAERDAHRPVLSKLLETAGVDGVATARFRHVQELLNSADQPELVQPTGDQAPGDIERLIEHLERTDLDRLFPDGPLINRQP